MMFPCIIAPYSFFLEYCAKSVSSLSRSFLLPAAASLPFKKKNFFTVTWATVFRHEKCQVGPDIVAHSYISTVYISKVMTLAASKCVHNLPQTSILLGKLITTEGTKKISAAPQGLWRPLHCACLTPYFIKYWTTHPGSLFHTLVPRKTLALPVASWWLEPINC
jgi:hypothetical protein